MIFNWSAIKSDSVGVVVGSLMNPQRYVFTTPKVRKRKRIERAESREQREQREQREPEVHC